MTPTRSRLRRALFGLLIGVGAIATLMAIAAALALQDKPLVALAKEPDHEDVARAMALLKVQDPRSLPNGTVHALSLSETDLELLMNHAGHRWLKATGQVRIGLGHAQLYASLRAPSNPFGRWLNVQAKVTQAEGLPRLQTLRIGTLPIPPWLAELAARWLVGHFGLRDQMLNATSAVQRVVFGPHRLQLQYVWRGGGESRRLLAALVPIEDQRRLRIYTERLAALTGQLAVGPSNQISLAPLLAPMFTLARERTEAGADAADENRAVLLVLTLLSIGRGIETLLPDAVDWPRPAPLQPTLIGRNDLPKHLLVSAVIAAEGTSPLSRAVGIYKEVADSRGGTGFSFDDIAADRAGTRLGVMALEEPVRLQRALADGVAEAEILPRVDDLPSNMPEPEFLRRFGGVAQPAYQAMIDVIDRRVDALALWRKRLATASR